MSITPPFDRTVIRGQLPRWVKRDESDEDLLEHLQTACVLLLLYETPATTAQLGDALAALRLSNCPAGIDCVLEAMEGDELVFTTLSPSTSVPPTQTFHIAPAGTKWLCRATGELRRSEGFLGAFVARCGEHLV